MATVTTTSSRVISQPRQQVYINGTLRPDILAAAVTSGYGVTPTYCTLRLPFLQAGANLSWLRNARVQVYIDGASSPIFNGWVVPEEQRDEPGQSTVHVTAASVLWALENVYIGQRTIQSTVSYPKRNPLTGNLTGWRISSILQSLFSSTALDANWQSTVGLGSLRAIQRAQVDADLPDLIFYTGTYREALRYLLSIVPDVGISEQFLSSGRTLLHFYQFGDPFSGYRAIRVPTATQGPEQGAYVTAMIARTDTEMAKTRVIGYGRPVERMITVGTDHATAPLEPAWANATVPLGSGPVTAAEARVLANPARATEGHPLSQFQYSKIFREFELPPVLWKHFIKQNNIYETFDGEQLRIQLFKPKFGAPDPETGERAILEDEWELIPAFEIDLENKILRLAEPALGVERVYQTEAGSLGQDFRAVNIYLTATWYNPTGERIAYDTGIRGRLNFQPWGNSGVVYSFANETIGYGTLGATLTDVNGTAHAFDCTYFDTLDEQWDTVTAAQPVITENNLIFLGNLCERVMAERSRRRVDASIRFPLVASIFTLGDNIRVFNRGIENTILNVTSVSMDLLNVSTTIQATDQVPYRVRAEGEKAPRATARAAQQRAWDASRGVDQSGADFRETMAPGGSPNQFGFNTSERFADQPIPEGSTVLTRPSGVIDIRGPGQ